MLTVFIQCTPEPGLQERVGSVDSYQVLGEQNLSWLLRRSPGEHASSVEPESRDAAWRKIIRAADSSKGLRVPEWSIHG